MPQANPNIIALEGKMYRKPWNFPLNIGGPEGPAIFVPFTIQFSENVTKFQ